MRLYLDDIRPTPEGFSHTVRSYEDFVYFIKTRGLPSFISFDNDLGCDENEVVLPDGYACAKWLVYESELDLTALNFKVHSANPVARVQIESLLNNYIKWLKLQ